MINEKDFKAEDQQVFDLYIDGCLVPAVTCRDFNGYKQYLETDAATGKKRWKFYVTGFDGSGSGQEGFCHVLKSDGTKEKVAIDKKDRILIHGRRYGRSQWNH